MAAQYCAGPFHETVVGISMHLVTKACSGIRLDVTVDRIPASLTRNVEFVKWHWNGGKIFSEGDSNIVLTLQCKEAGIAKIQTRSPVLWHRFVVLQLNLNICDRS